MCRDDAGGRCRRSMNTPIFDFVRAYADAGVILLLNLLQVFLKGAELVLTGFDVCLDLSQLLLQGCFRIEALVELGVKLLHVDGSNLDFGLSRGGQSAQRHEGGGDDGEFHNM